MIKKRGCGNWFKKIMKKSKYDASRNHRTGVSVWFSQQKEQDMSAIFDWDIVWLFYDYNKTLPSHMLTLCFWDNQFSFIYDILMHPDKLRYFYNSRENYLDVSSYGSKSWIVTVVFYLSQNLFFSMLILFIWRIMLVLTLCPLLFIFKISINGLLQTMIHRPTRMKSRM